MFENHSNVLRPKLSEQQDFHNVGNSFKCFATNNFKKSDPQGFGKKYANVGRPNCKKISDIHDFWVNIQMFCDQDFRKGQIFMNFGCWRPSCSTRRWVLTLHYFKFCGYWAWKTRESPLASLRAGDIPPAKWWPDFQISASTFLNFGDRPIWPKSDYSSFSLTNQA